MWGDPKLPFKFWERVAPANVAGCWLWMAGGANGYGQIYDGEKTRYSHRVAYEALVGPIPAGLQIDHLCRTRRCVNPGHLEPVTRRVNILRGTAPSASNAQKTHCHRGHAFSADNTYVDPTGERVCKTCRRANHHERKRRAGV